MCERERDREIETKIFQIPCKACVLYRRHTHTHTHTYTYTHTCERERGMCVRSHLVEVSSRHEGPIGESEVKGVVLSVFKSKV